MPTEAERVKVLEMVAAGTVSAEDALRLLDALDGDSGGSARPGVAASPIAAESGPNSGQVHRSGAGESGTDVDNPPAPLSSAEIQKWKRWWVLPAGIGAVFAALGAWWMYAVWGGFWVLCAAVPLLLGLFLLILSVSSRQGLWLHLRVQQPPGEKPQRIAISFPIPVYLTALGLRLFGRFIPKTEGVDLSGLLLALNAAARDGAPLFVDVDEGDGEHVQIFIG